MPVNADPQHTRGNNFAVARGAGIVATMAGMLVINSDWAKFYPWTLPGLVSLGFMEGEAIAAELALGIVGSGMIDDQICRYVGADYRVADAMGGVHLCQKLMADNNG